MPVALIPAALSLGVGLYQTIFSGKRKAEKRLEQQVNNAPTYAGNKGVGDYYNEVYNRYMTSPTNSALYQNSINNINRNSANILSGLQDRRGALDAAGQIEAANNAGANNALIAAENQRNERFGILGNATAMKNADDMQKFQINTIMPYQSKLSLLSTKASSKNQQFNQGLSNIYNAAGAASTYYANKDNANDNPMQQQQSNGYNPNQGGGGGSWNPSYGYNNYPN